MQKGEERGEGWAGLHLATCLGLKGSRKDSGGREDSQQVHLANKLQRWGTIIGECQVERINEQPDQVDSSFLR